MSQEVAELRLSRRAWESVAEHVRAAVPDEAVGILAGTSDGRVAYVARLPNLAAGGAYVADPRAQFEAERTFSRLGLIPLAAYHSHPGGTPTLSSADRMLANPSLVQLVVAVDRKGRIEMCAYRVAAVPRQVPVRVEA
jgi:[CysO sulfur-carrier protein]-S-L-cysteine hydrolase